MQCQKTEHHPKRIMPNKQANQEDLWMMSSNHLIDVAEGMTSMQYKRNLICIAACFRVEENVGVKNPNKGGGVLFIPLVYAVHSQDNCQVVFEL